jgi:hypothetical protein
LVLGHQTLFASDILSRWARLLLENPLHYACANARLPADFEDPVTVGPEFPYSCLDRRLYASPAELGAVLASSRQARIYALTKYPAFKFRKHS